MSAVHRSELAEALKGLKAQLGVYAVLGNHDWWFDGQKVWRALQNVRDHRAGRGGD